MNELLTEIQDDLRRERIDRLWNSFGKVMVAVSLVVILATIVIVMLNNHRTSNAMKDTAQFIAGIDRLGIEDYKGAVEIFSTLAEDDSNYYGMAMMHKAQAETAWGHKEEAQKTYATLAENDQVFGSLAVMQLQGKTVEPDLESPFYHTMAEWRAWQLVQEGKKDDAVKLFSGLRDDEEAPPSLRERAAEAVQHLAPRQAGVTP